jgi:hypothetical protein
MPTTPQFGQRAPITPKPAAITATKPAPSQSGDEALPLRPFVMIWVSYFLAPGTGTSVVWVLALIAHYLHLPISLMSDWVPKYGDQLSILDFMFPVAVYSLLGFLLEVVFVTPILFAYRHFQWRWINTWSITAIGLGVSALATLGVQLAAGPVGQDYHPIHASVTAGLIGFFGAFVFRLLAFGPTDPDPLASPAIGR